MTIKGVGLVVHSLRLQDKVGGGAYLCTQGDKVEVDDIDANQDGNLNVHLVQGDVDIGTSGEVEQVVAFHTDDMGVKDIGGLEVQHFGLHIETANGHTAKDTCREMVRESGLDVGFVVRQFRSLETDFRTNGDVEATAGECCAAHHEQGGQD